MLFNTRVFALVVLATLASACDAPREARGPIARDTGARDDRAQFDEPGAIRVGWRGPTSGGGGFSVSVGSQFGQKDAEEVLRRLVALDSSGAFKQFTCGDSVPHFGFDLTLHQEGPVQERIVSLGYTPYPKPWGRERCLHQGFDYLVALTFAQVDTGPSVDYGYKNPSTGKVIPSSPPGERHSRWWPTCDCAKRDSVQEWVKNGPEETSLGVNAQ